MKPHQFFPLIISLCKKPQFLCLFFNNTDFFFFFGRTTYLNTLDSYSPWSFLWEVLLRPWKQLQNVLASQATKSLWFTLHKSFLQLTVQLFSPLPSHLEFFPLYFVSGWTWISMLHGYLWLGFFLHCLMSSVEISRLTGSWHFSEIYTLSLGH